MRVGHQIEAGVPSAMTTADRRHAEARRYLSCITTAAQAEC